MSVADQHSSLETIYPRSSAMLCNVRDLPQGIMKAIKARARRWLGPVTVTAACMLCVAFTNAVAGQQNPTVISSEWQVDLRTVGSVGGIVVTGVVWMTRKLTIIFTHMQNTDDRLSKIENTLSDITRKLK